MTHWTEDDWDAVAKDVFWYKIENPKESLIQAFNAVQNERVAKTHAHIAKLLPFYDVEKRKMFEKFEEKTEVEEELSDREILCRAAGIVHDRFTESEPYKLLFKEEMFQYEEKVVKRRAVHKIVVVGPKKNQQHILHTHFEGVANLSFKIVPNALVYVCWTRFMSHSDEEKCKKYGDIIRFDGGLSGLINIINNVVETS